MSQNNAASGSGTTVFIVVTVSETVICCDSAVRGTVTIYEGIKSDSSTWVEQKNKIVTIELEGPTGELVSGEGHAFLDFYPQGPEDCGKFIYFLGHGPPNYSAAVKSAGVGIIKLAASGKLWWFNGVTPENYPTEITLTRSPSDFLTSKWNITAGANLVELVSPVSGETGTTMTTGAPYIKIRSKAASIQKDDVTIEHETADKKCTFKLSVYTVKTVPNNQYPENNASQLFVWETQFAWRILDQFDGHTIASPLEQHEEFGGRNQIWQGDYNWVTPKSGSGFTSSDVMWGVDDLSDIWALGVNQGPGAPSKPQPVGPTQSGADAIVDSIKQDIYLGSLEMGKGVKVISRTVNRHRGYAKEAP